MNRITKKLFSAAVIVCLSISSVAAYAAQITPSSTSITLGKNDKEISFDITVGSSTLTGKIGDSLNWSFIAQSGKLTISGTFPTDAKLIAAVYTADGKLVGTRILTAEGETALPDGAAIKLFLLDGTTNAPLCQSETVKNP